MPSPGTTCGKRPKKPEPAYLLFVGLNLALVGSALALTFGREPWLLYVFAVPIVLAEVRPFFRARTRWRRALVLYLAFLWMSGLSRARACAAASA